ncbi:MAG: xanthine dehydrogenase family protein molybdopterin-binding subunit [Alphaproteobacteria bacterium]
MNAIPKTPNLSRRAVLTGIGGLAAGLTLGVWLPKLAKAQSGIVDAPADPSKVFTANAFIQVGIDDTVTVLIKHIEFGQGPFTGLTTLVAEEMDADWSQMRATHAPADVSKYVNKLFGMQGTGGSTAMASSFTVMREAGAAARAMLVEAAADEWGVPASEITISKGVVSHQASGRTIGFGALSPKAAMVPVPETVTLKDPKDFVFIGKDMPKLDTFAKTTGEATFTQDVFRFGMIVAAVAHPPAFGATVKSFDATDTLKVRDVIEVKQIPTGVAVYARHTFAAFKGRDALKVEWDTSAAETRSSKQMIADYKKATEKKGLVAAEIGVVDKRMEHEETVHEAVYEFPFLAHAPMEPLDGVIERRGDEVEAWLGSQIQTMDHGTIAGVMGLKPEQVQVHTMLAGGSFGRRAQPDSGFAAELASVLKATDQEKAVKLVWSREDDIRGGRYRPLGVHRLKGAIDKDGNISGWDQTIAIQSIMMGTGFEDFMVRDGIDATSVEGASDMPYRISDVRVSVHNMQNGVPPLWWRSVGHTHTAFAVEVFLDELLRIAGRDPLQARLDMMGVEFVRERAVLERVADLADWGGPVPEGRARGVAVHKSFNSYVAQVAEVSQGEEDGVPRVHKVWCAVDCGIPVNPNVIRAQMEGGIGYGLGHILYGSIDLEEGGAVRQSNFDEYRSLRINEMPEVDVAIIDSTEPPTGVGEPGTPPVGAAVANAWIALTGQRIRRLPFTANQTVSG